MENDSKTMSLIKKDFENGNKHSVLSALKKFGTTELRRIVSRLKKQGLNVCSEWQEYDGKRFKIYWLGA